MEAFEQHLMLRADHVVVVVGGEAGVQAIGWFGGLAVADVIGKDEEVASDIERLTGAEEDVREDGIEERGCVAAGAMEEEDGVFGMALGVAVEGAESEGVEVCGEGFAGVEAEVGDVVVEGGSGPGGRGGGLWLEGGLGEDGGGEEKC